MLFSAASCVASLHSIIGLLFHPLHLHHLQPQDENNLIEKCSIFLKNISFFNKQFDELWSRKEEKFKTSSSGCCLWSHRRTENVFINNNNNNPSNTNNNRSMRNVNENPYCCDGVARQQIDEIFSTSVNFFYFSLSLIYRIFPHFIHTRRSFKSSSWLHMFYIISND